MTLSKEERLKNLHQFVASSRLEGIECTDEEIIFFEFAIENEFSEEEQIYLLDQECIDRGLSEYEIIILIKDFRVKLKIKVNKNYK